jgi:hypothetical protein
MEPVARGQRVQVRRDVQAEREAEDLAAAQPAAEGPPRATARMVRELYVTNGDQVVVLRPNAASPPTATVFATGVPGANGVAFDRDGNLWVSDGGTAQGRVWRVPHDGGAGVEVFRVQPTSNDVVDATLGISGVGRDNRSLPPGTITIAPTGRQASNTLGSQAIVANGLAFTEDGALLVADTARGALWRVDFDRRGRVVTPTGCDASFPADTLCLDAVWVRASVPRRRGRDRARPRGERVGGAQRAERDRRRRPPGAHDRAAPQPAHGGTAPERGAARVPDEPVPPRPDVLRDAVRRQPPRQLPEHRR